MPQLQVAVLAASLLAPIQEPGGAAAPTVVLEGRVVDLRGEPVPLAEITVATWQQPDVVLAKGTCDGDGAFRIGRVPRLQSWRVEARRDGYCRTRVVTADEALPVRIELRDAATVRGMLRDHAGRPVAGAAVRAAPLYSRPPLSDGPTDARTDVGGAFTLRGVPLGMVRVSAVVPGEGLAERREWIRGDADLVLEPDPAAATTTLQVVVEGVPSQALAGVSAFVSRLNNDNGTLPPPWCAPEFDRAGCFELQAVPDAGYRVGVRADGLLFGPARITTAGGPRRLRFEASPTPRCPALVCDREGAPVAGVQCEMSSVRAPQPEFVAVIMDTRAVSAADGTVTFASPAPLGSVAYVRSRDRRWVGRLQATVDPATTMQLRVVPACRVRGRVVQHDGGPAPFVDVELSKPDVDRRADLMPTTASAITDRHGNFEFGGLRYLEDRLCVAALSDHGAAISEPFTLDASDQPRSVPLLVLQAPTTVEGRITDAAGPAPGVHVRLQRSDSGGRVVGFGYGGETITDRDGRFRFLVMPPGSAAIDIVSLTSISECRRAVEAFEVAAGKKYSFELERGP